MRFGPRFSEQFPQKIKCVCIVVCMEKLDKWPHYPIHSLIYNWKFRHAILVPEHSFLNCDSVGILCTLHKRVLNQGGKWEDKCLDYSDNSRTRYITNL